MVKATDETDGRHIENSFDTADTQPWSWRETVLDPQNRLIEIADTPDSGRVGWTAAQVKQFWSQFDANGDPVGEPVQQVVAPSANPQEPQVLAGAAIGSYLGSMLGQAIGGSNVFVHVAAGTVLSALLGNIGAGLHGFNTGVAGASTLTAAANETLGGFGNLGSSLQSAFASQAVGAISSFLTGELAEALHFDGSSFGSQLIRAETGTLINTVLGNIAAGSNPFLHLGGNLIDGATSFAGSYLAHLIATPTSTIGQIGGSVGGWLGSAIGAGLAGSGTVLGSIGSGILTGLGLGNAFGIVSDVILGFLMPGIGAFVGTLLGTFLGNAFGSLFHHDQTVIYQGASAIVLDPGSDHFSDGDANGWQSNGTDATLNQIKATLQNTATATAQSINQLLAAIGGHVAADYPITVKFTSINSSNGTFGVGIETSTLAIETDPSSTAYGELVPHTIDLLNSRDSLSGQALVNYGAIHALKYVDIVGGNIYMKRVIDHSHASTLDQLAGELKVAEDYGRYLANKNLIDDLVALNPNCGLNFPVWQPPALSRHSSERRIN